MVTEEDYQRAQLEPSYRPYFLEKVDLEQAAPYIEKVYYIEQEWVETLQYFRYPKMATAVHINHTKPIVNVCPAAFDLRTLDEFLSVLIDHEGYHAQDYVTNNITASHFLKRKEDIEHNKIANPELAQKMLLVMEGEHQFAEYKAYYHQFTQAKNRKLSNEFKDAIYDRICSSWDKTYDALDQIYPNSIYRHLPERMILLANTHVGWSTVAQLGSRSAVR